ncbi:alpha-2-macroglobulin-like protein 1 isoform X2 [Polypterus senegalus]|uniref:alpha-2-macroglobulin-like protein 1 isoform X2 n=1 Tax=Polypterus senegalus TaxID=55291 RepID=UPI001965E60F|nr:alpha-2-macroglobulin-like protein 1 isoform X2 [Polypterus senegalus]
MWKLLLSACLFLHYCEAEISTEPKYVVIVPCALEGGSMAKLCAQVLNPNETMSFNIRLKIDLEEVHLMKETVKEKDFYRCINFQVPLVSANFIAYIHAELQGKSFKMTSQKKVSLTVLRPLTFIQTDKPVYKPGQVVKFRVVSLEKNLVPLNLQYPSVVLTDPNSNRIGQWLNKSSTGGILDLSFVTSSEAPVGNYMLTVWRNEEQKFDRTFEIKEYVMPKMELKLNVPNVISVYDENSTVQACAKYTFGKPVMGKINFTFCPVPKDKYNMYNYYKLDDTCWTVSNMTDKSGCVSQTVNVGIKKANFYLYSKFNVHADLEEEGTGVTMRTSKASTLSIIKKSITILDADDSFKVGYPMHGKIKLTNADHSPAVNETVYLRVSYHRGSEELRFLTDQQGMAYFTLDTSSWNKNTIGLRAYFPVNYYELQGGYYQTYDDIKVIPFYSRSSSFVIIHGIDEVLECGTEAQVMTSYTVKRALFEEGTEFMYFYYLVMSKGVIVLSGRVEIILGNEKESKGDFFITVPVTMSMSPAFKVLVYSVLPNGEMIAHKSRFKVNKCFANKVELRFSDPQELPAEETTLHLRASPGSLCALRSIDRGILLLGHAPELTADLIYNSLPKSSSDYPFQLLDNEPYSCIHVRQEVFGLYRQGKDVFDILKSLCLKILTNAEVARPVPCYISDKPLADEGSGAEDVPDTPPVKTPSQPKVETVRKFFPETWIWDLVSVGETGSLDLHRTVPDSITEWQADAFCTSPEGFGLAPPTFLTVFQPFFVELTLPYSVVRGEEFNLKASVFNYLATCIMLQVTAVESQDYQLKPCEGCKYKTCLCSSEIQTFNWTLTPTVLGEIDITVRAESLNTKELCGNEVVTVPSRGRADTVIRKLLVEAEGLKKAETQNSLLCLKGSTVTKNISLTLPDVFIEGSAKAFVSVLGDVMGRALQNLDGLLVMPYGCGEQNMVRFAPNIYILKYLEETGQMTEPIKQKGINFMQSGYQRELTYKHYDGSYSAFGMSDETGNTWLTAFVMKSFGSAQHFIFINPSHINDAKKWLEGRQNKNGCFQNVGRLLNAAMKGGVGDEVSLTAYITAALLELKTPVTDLILKRGLACLISKHDQVNDLYTKILLAYVFSLANDQKMRHSLHSSLDQVAMKKGDALYWTHHESESKMARSAEVEMTSYMLLSLVSGSHVSDSDLAYASKIVKWLIQQQNSRGGFSSTQDTVVALQALSSYAAHIYSKDSTASGSVSVISAQETPIKFHLDQNNRLLYQEERLEKVPGEYIVEVEGHICAFVQFALQYNVPPPTDFSTFNISAMVDIPETNLAKSILQVTIVVSYNGKREKTNMAILNIKLLSGYIMETNSLAKLESAPFVKRIDKADGYIDVYLDELPRMKPQKYVILIEEEIPVEKLKAAVVRIYDFYHTEEHAETEYSAPSSTGIEEA